MQRDRGGCSIRTMLMLTLGIALVGLLGYTMLASGDGPGIMDTMLPQPTSTFRPGPTVIEAIRREATLETVAMTISSDTTVQREHGILGACSEELTYLGYFDVTAGIDLSRISSANIESTNDGFPEQAQVTITLPPAEITHVELDTTNSRIVAQSTPKWLPGCSHEIAEMTTEAQQKLRDYARSAALERGILGLAEQHAAQTLTQLLQASGYRNVTVRYASSNDGATPVPTFGDPAAPLGNQPTPVPTFSN